MYKSSLDKSKYNYKCPKGSTKDFPNLLIYKKVNMPTVKFKGGMKKFPYHAVGKAQADSFAKMMKGKIKDNPGYHMETKSY